MSGIPVRSIIERQVAVHFLEAGAVSMVDAIPFAPDHPAQQRAFDRMKGHDILKTDGTGRWWLDEQAWTMRRSDRRTKAVLALLAVGVAAVVAALR